MADTLKKIIPINLNLTETNVFKNETYQTNETFWTSDINSAYLEFTTDTVITSGTASLALKNVDDGSVVQRTIELSASTFEYMLREKEVARAGRWYGQVVVTSEGKYLTSTSFRFLIKGGILDSSEPALFDIDNYTKLSEQLVLLYDQIGIYLADIALSERDRELAETTRGELFTDSQTARVLAFEASQLERQQAYNQLIEGTESDVETIKTESKNTIDTMIFNGDSAINAAKDSASQSAQTAQQAMADYLAMVGVDIATLGADGKLSANQIPALAINDTFVVHSEAEIIALTAQRGDVAIYVQSDTVADAYILAADSPTILANWIKLGVSYVSQAGHAETATNAVNSEKVNGHRLVTMTQSEYDLGAKDANTVYLVEG